MLKLSEVSFAREGVPIFGPLNLDVQPGQSLAILGVNGAGKSTLLKLMAGLLRPTSGHLTCREAVNFMGHILPLDPRLNVTQNLEFLGGGQNIYGNVPVQTLSQGEQKKVFLSYFTSQSQKKIWLMDEPFSHLDQAAITDLVELLKLHQAEGGCVVLTHHGELPMVLDQKIEL